VYRRRRIGAALVAALLLLGGAWVSRAVASVLGGVPASISEDDVAAARLTPGSAYVVEPGDTLWGIAGRISSDRSRADLVQAMVDALGGPRLHPGDVVVLPG
jgi:Tfp pilus assembly protein FimV